MPTSAPDHFDDDDEEDDDREAPDPSDRDDIDDDDAETVSCPHCRKSVYEQAEICPHCGSFISFSDERRQPLWIWIAAILALIGATAWIFLFFL
jgi:hypothetical protein